MHRTQKKRKKTIAIAATDHEYSAISRAAKSARMSRTQWLLLAAEEKLAREEAAKQKDNAA